MESTTTANGTAAPDDDNQNGSCLYETVDFDRFMLVTAFGSPCAVLGIAFNSILFGLLCRSHHVRTPDLYLTVLAMMDTLFCICYLCLMTVDAVSLYMGILPLYGWYMMYLCPVFALARIIQLSAVYMMVLATIERYFMIRRWSQAYNQGYLTAEARAVLVVVVLLICAALRAPVAWEHEVVRVECDDPFGVFQFTAMLADDPVYTFFNFYIMNMVQVFVPFSLLTVLNVNIILTLQRRLSLAKKFLFPVRYVSEVTFEKGTSREKLKSATYTLAAIVAGYLISNVCHTGITVLEYANFQHLLKDENGASLRWYTLFSDISSALTALNCCIRFPVFCCCSQVIRREALMFFVRYRYGVPMMEK